MAINRQESLEIRTEADIALARETCRRLLEETGFDQPRQVGFTTAVSELTRNVIKYADQGFCRFDTYRDRTRCRISAIVEDRGPGISDVEKAMQAGFSTGGTLGAGLSGVPNLVDEFDIESSSAGTRVVIAMRGEIRS